MCLITVFTPTYNRFKTLKKCYESLIKQTSKNFIWQVVDDGSTDNTEKLINDFIKEKKINIEYYKKNNGGKFTAINYSLNITKTELWFCLDSDDYLFDNAVELIERYYQKIKNKELVCGLLTYRSTDKGQPMQKKPIPMVGKYETQFNIRYILNYPPEYVQIYKTDIIKRYPFPCFENEKYMPLSYQQDQIDQKYKFLIIDENIMVCYYRNDGITKNSKRLIYNNPLGYREFKKYQIKIAPNLLFLIKACICFDVSCLLIKTKDWYYKTPSILTIPCMPFAIIVYFIWFYCDKKVEKYIYGYKKN